MIDSPKYPCGAPCLRYMGEVYGLPLFKDCCNSGHILPNGKGVLEYGDMGAVIQPIIIGGTHDDKDVYMLDIIAYQKYVLERTL